MVLGLRLSIKTWQAACSIKQYRRCNLSFIISAYQAVLGIRLQIAQFGDDFQELSYRIKYIRDKQLID